MAIKQIGLFSLLMVVAVPKLFPQDCGSLDSYLKNKGRKYYILNGSDSASSMPRLELLNSVAPKDTALLQEIAKNGTKSNDYAGFFRQKGISTKPIGLDQFIDLPDDTVLLTKQETHLRKRYDKLLEEENALINAGKPYQSIDRDLNKKKYEALREKLSTRNPYLFMMYPIYKYKGYTLVVFGVKTCRGCENVFRYDLCNK